MIARQQQIRKEAKIKSEIFRGIDKHLHHYLKTRFSGKNLISLLCK